MRKFVLYNHDRSEAFDLNSDGIIAYDQSTGLGNKRVNTLIKDSRIRSYISSSKNNFVDIVLKIMFGMGGTNAYAKYNALMMFIQRNGLKHLVLGYWPQNEELYVDVVLSESTKSNKTQYGVLEEIFTFERLTSFYKFQREEKNIVLIQNNYYENVLPKLIIKDRLRVNPRIDISSNNLATTPENIDGNYDGIEVRKNNDGSITFKGTSNVNQGITIANVFKPKGYYWIGIEVTNDGAIGGGIGMRTNDVDSWFAITTQKQLFYRAINNLYYYPNVNEKVDFTIRIMIEKGRGSGNLVSPDLSGATTLENEGIMRISDSNGVTVDYDYREAEFIVNGTVIAEQTQTLTLTNFGELRGLYRAEKFYVRGTTSSDWGVTVNHKGFSEPDFTKLNYYADQSLLVYNFDGIVFMFMGFSIGQTFDNLTFKLMMKPESEIFPFEHPIKGASEYTSPNFTSRNISITQTLQAIDTVIIDAELLLITKNGVPSYEMVSKMTETFPIIPLGEYIIESEQSIIVEWKEWVID